MPWNLGSKTITRVWQFIDQFTAGEAIDRADHDIALDDIKASVNDAIAYLITEIGAAASSELYLGVAPSPPTENAAGGPLEQGNLYIKSPEYEAYVWTGSEWTLAEQFAVASTYFKGLVSATDAAALRALLGLGSIATFSSTSFASQSDVAAEAERLTNALRPIQTGGTGNAFTAASADPITAYADGQAWLLRADRAPTGASTLNVDGLGPKDIRKLDASNSLVDISSGDWGIGDIFPAFYDGTRFIIPRYALPPKTLPESDWEAGTSTTESLVSPSKVAAAVAALESSQIKAWVNFNGTGVAAIRASFNVSSITDNGQGDYTINFTEALVDANYVVTASVGRGAGASAGRIAFAPHGDAPTTTSVRVSVSDNGGTLQDSEFVNITIVR